MTEKLLNAEEVAERLGYSTKTVRQLVADGKLEAVRFSPNGHLRFLEGDVEAHPRAVPPPGDRGRMSALETRDIPGVEILEASIRIRGRGSPPEGDLYTQADLEAIAAASRELAGELRPPVKLGHGRLLEAGEAPAVGWVENLRVRGDKLVADLRRVPATVAKLMSAGGYRHRSVELSKVTSRTGKRYPLVVSGLALLGATRPAVATLTDVARLYESSGLEIETRRVYQLAGEELEDPFAVVDVDQAIAEGRIPEAHREAWSRAFETAPELARELVPAPDRELAYRNAHDTFWSDPENVALWEATRPFR